MKKPNPTPYEMSVENMQNLWWLLMMATSAFFAKILDQKQGETCTDTLEKCILMMIDSEKIYMNSKKLTGKKIEMI